jgi:hypothetical protein
LGAFIHATGEGIVDIVQGVGFNLEAKAHGKSDGPINPGGIFNKTVHMKNSHLLGLEIPNAPKPIQEFFPIKFSPMGLGEGLGEANGQGINGEIPTIEIWVDGTGFHFWVSGRIGVKFRASCGNIQPQTPQFRIILPEESGGLELTMHFQAGSGIGNLKLTGQFYPGAIFGPFLHGLVKTIYHQVNVMEQ